MENSEELIHEPYLGRPYLHGLDVLIPVAMQANIASAKWTHGKKLSPLQRAACQIIPNSFAIGLSIRELIRKGYLFPAEILLRPLLERIAVVSYLQREGDPAIELWEKGWPYNSRPKLPKLMEAITDFQQQHSEHDFIQAAKELIGHFNSLVHGDPVGLDSNIGVTLDGVVGYLGGANLTDPQKCDQICSMTVITFSLLIIRANQIFPDAFLNFEDGTSQQHLALREVQQLLKRK